VWLSPVSYLFVSGDSCSFLPIREERTSWGGIGELWHSAPQAPAQLEPNSSPVPKKKAHYSGIRSDGAGERGGRPAEGEKLKGLSGGDR
jgi:hypothetical protein